MTPSAYKNAKNKWVIPQVYFVSHGNGKRISRQKLLEKVANNTLLQEMMRIELRIRDLVEEAKKERCITGYHANERFYLYYKPKIVKLVGWEARNGKLQSMKHYDTLYETIYELLPGDEWDIYPDGIMPNGMYCPTWQERYESECPA